MECGSSVLGLRHPCCGILAGAWLWDLASDGAAVRGGADFHLGRLLVSLGPVPYQSPLKALWDSGTSCMAPSRGWQLHYCGAAAQKSPSGPGCSKVPRRARLLYSESVCIPHLVSYIGHERMVLPRCIKTFFWLLPGFLPRSIRWKAYDTAILTLICNRSSALGVFVRSYFYVKSYAEGSGVIHLAAGIV